MKPFARARGRRVPRQRDGHGDRHRDRDRDRDRDRASGGKRAPRHRGRRRKPVGRRPALTVTATVAGVLAVVGGVAVLRASDQGAVSAGRAGQSVRTGAAFDAQAGTAPGDLAGTPAASGGSAAARAHQALASSGATRAPAGGPAAQAQGSSPAEATSGVAQAETSEVAQVGGDADSGKEAGGPSVHTDQKAAEYFKTHWGDDRAAKRLKDIRTVGGYLRIYTDLPESAHNSSQAITLCKRGLEYLKEAGVASPVVFVQAKYGENGNPVLANILGPSDTSCRVTHPEPD
ncbi:hypothetical protein ABZ297_19480 [Nonomuraea sp. NPDC005983]|uniref:hypothetical protein n=1 Tax=Nonomuraea sp. NPDC005983 TaxID=3155595 RepID=UPI0033BAABAD